VGEGRKKAEENRRDRDCAWRFRTDHLREDLTCETEVEEDSAPGGEATRGNEGTGGLAIGKKGMRR